MKWMPVPLSEAAPVALLPMPRIAISEALNWPLLISMLGTLICTSSVLLISCLSSSSPVMAVTAIGVSCSVVSRFSAVTTTSSSAGGR